ncbi:MAG: glucosidase [Proteobacteria bacterium]|nr:glucosidase [Pseudomonadota bacterium]
MPNEKTKEQLRLDEAREQKVPWRKWGPYLSERQWGTVREEYSDDGNAWQYFSHDQARSRAYHWGEDGLAGVSDDHGQLCFALALWNGRDPIIKERLFGMTNSEGNHGEDVKEYYFYLDSTPTHSYMKYLYKYPQNAFPYDELVATNKKRTRAEMEYELLDTGVFDEDRYFDVFVEYAKDTPEDLLIRISVANRGPEAADIDLLPTLWFHNTWSWAEGEPRPALKKHKGMEGIGVVEASHEKLGNRYLYCEGDAPLIFTENETNNKRVFGTPNRSPYVKDGINEFVVHENRKAVNPDGTGTKAVARYRLRVGPGETKVVRLKLTANAPQKAAPFGVRFDEIMATRQREADEFYRSITPPKATEDEARVMRQALSGMLWSKQHYFFDLDMWLAEHGANPANPRARAIRNKEWFHMVNDDIISMPDKWEYPWYAAWDLAFHCVALASVDPDFAKSQLDLLFNELYLHPNGQIPAYEWNFSDVNPPVHAWASFYIYNMEKAKRGEGDVHFLKRAFGKLMLNFTWWVNRKDRFGKNVFEGGFLGLDNIGVFDRSAPLPTGGYLEQADGTAWMALFCQNMAEIGAELSVYDPVYEDLTMKFMDHLMWISIAMNRMGGEGEGMWDEEDGFYYDVLRMPDGTAKRLKVRSMVGLLPLCATTIVEKYQRDHMPKLMEHFQNRIKHRPEIMKSVHATGPGHFGCAERGIIALVNEERLRRILARMLDPNEFLSPYGIRALSREHAEHPYEIRVGHDKFTVNYLPAESDTGMFGGNSNWRGPIWLPVNALIIRALQQFYLYYGDNFKIECPTGSGRMMNLYQVSKEIADRLSRIFLKDGQGRRPVFGGAERFQRDPNWRDNILFYEYFHGDNGAGLGASHQTGWTGIVGTMIQLYGFIDPKRILEEGKAAAFRQVAAGR